MELALFGLELDTVGLAGFEFFEEAEGLAGFNFHPLGGEEGGEEGEEEEARPGLHLGD